MEREWVWMSENNGVGGGDDTADESAIKLALAVSEVQSVIGSSNIPFTTIEKAVLHTNYSTSAAIQLLLNNPNLEGLTVEQKPQQHGFVMVGPGQKLQQPSLLLDFSSRSETNKRKCPWCETLNDPKNIKCFVCDTTIQVAGNDGGRTNNNNNNNSNSNSNNNNNNNGNNSNTVAVGVNKRPTVDPIDEVELPPGFENLSESTERAIKAAIYAENQARERAALAEEEATRLFLQAEAKARQQELDKKKYNCVICFDERTINDIYILEECNHRFCRDCLSEHCAANINDGNTRDIRCPFDKCKHIVSYMEVKQLVPAATMEKYEAFLLRAVLESDPNCSFCPRPGCSMAMIANGGLMLVCPNDKCKFTFCRNCKEEWHADSTCEQYKQWKIDNGQGDAKFADWAKQNTKPCPKCKKPIEKNGGCNHMTCKHPGCKYEFCWLCMGQYKSGHFGDKSKCKQFT